MKNYKDIANQIIQRINLPNNLDDKRYVIEVILDKYKCNNVLEKATIARVLNKMSDEKAKESLNIKYIADNIKYEVKESVMSFVKK